MTLFCKAEDIVNESDVEQKLILPILTSQYPLGFGYSKSDFRTKPDIRKINIGKGATQKLYYPDYVIIIQGLPVIIIEAKKPGEDIEEALREARLYASELNSAFPAGINPCSRIIVIDGKTIISSSWDSKTVDVRVNFNQIDISSEEYTKLVKLHSKESIASYCDKVFKKIRGKRKFSRPTSLLGGNYVRKEEFPENSFGSNLALEYRHLFNPVTTEDRLDIVRYAYVPSKRREKHLDPINRIIRAARPSSVTDAKTIEDTTKPKEIYTKFNDSSKLKNELLLLIGNVGSGKSTFVDYLKEVSLPDDIKEKTVWITIDLNDAPLSKDQIYKWLQNNIIKTLKTIHNENDFDDLETLKKLYSVELNRVRKGPAAFFPVNSEKYNDLMAKKLYELQDNLEITAKAYVRYLCAEREKLLVVVLDNCDKRNKEEQLLMFDVAKWFKKEYFSLVFLPLRDITYDHHRFEPPLDTVIKDLVFRIDPPSLVNVLYKRIEHALTDSKKRLSYSLPNGMVVNYNQSEQKIYLACILKSLFNNDPFFRQLVNGIAGRDIRRGIEIFLDFCKSGHISEAEILKIRSSKGDYVLPSYLITRVLFRGNRRYYGDESSFIKNLFASFPEEESIADPFVRIAILQWLKNRYRKHGPNQVLGYHKVSELLNYLIPLGHSETRIIKELGTLARARCILTESQDDEAIGYENNDEVLGSNIVAEDALISIAPAGHIHLELLVTNLDYLASCAEDVWYEELQIAQKIADRLTGKEGSGYLSLLSNISNATDLINYLIDYQKKTISMPGAYLENNAYEKLINLDYSLDVIHRTKINNKFIVNIEKLKKDFPPGMVVEGQVVSVQHYGVFVEFGLNAVGLLHISRFKQSQKPEDNILLQNIETGERLKVEIIRFEEKHGKFDLKLPESAS